MVGVGLGVWVAVGTGVRVCVGICVGVGGCREGVHDAKKRTASRNRFMCFIYSPLPLAPQPQNEILTKGWRTVADEDFLFEGVEVRAVGVFAIHDALKFIHL